MTTAARKSWEALPKAMRRDPHSPADPPRILDERSSLVLRVILTGAGIAAVIVVIRGLCASTLEQSITYAAGSLMVALAALVVGAIFGFIFGIPRFLTHQVARESPQPRSSEDEADEQNTQEVKRSDYAPNTNLEQISDWLTKILVGVGLTNLAYVAPALSSLGARAAPAFGTFQGREAFALAVMLFFALCGFLLAYLWTRIYLPLNFAQADRDTSLVYSRVMRDVNKRLDEQAARDAKAFQLVQQQLELSPDAPDVPQLELNTAIKEASAGAHAQIFYLAEKTRRENWSNPETLHRMERTEPIFRALNACDSEQKLHASLGQLGFVLANKRRPQYHDAIDCLTKAIERRGTWKENGWVHYEMVRAYCRLQQLGKETAPPEIRQKILDDLRVVSESEIRGKLESDPVLKGFWTQHHQSAADSNPPPVADPQADKPA